MPVDIAMTVILLCLMAYQVSGEALHEWFGIAMTILLIVHHILNRRWYVSLFKGRYNPYRIMTTSANMMLLIAIGLTAVCGMSMSNHAVPFLYGILPVSFARRIHLSISYWSFLLMGLHLGFHLPAMTAKMNLSKTTGTVLNCLFVVVAGLGLGCFLRNGISDYLFFKTPFAFFDYDKSGLMVFLENLAELLCFAFIGTNLVRLVQGKKKTEKHASLFPLINILLCILIGVGILYLNKDKGSASDYADSQNTESVSEKADSEVTENGESTKPAEISDGFVMISGGTSMSEDVSKWLDKSGIERQR